MTSDIEDAGASARPWAKEKWAALGTNAQVMRSRLLVMQLYAERASAPDCDSASERVFTALMISAGNMFERLMDEAEPGFEDTADQMLDVAIPIIRDFVGDGPYEDPDNEDECMYCDHYMSLDPTRHAAGCAWARGMLLLRVYDTEAAAGAPAVLKEASDATLPSSVDIYGGTAGNGAPVPPGVRVPGPEEVVG